MKKFVLKLVFAFSVIFYSASSYAIPPSGPINHHYLYIIISNRFGGPTFRDEINICHVNDHDGTLTLPCKPQKIEVENWLDKKFNLQLRSIAVIPDSEYAYVLAVNGGVYLCKINDENGQFTSCRHQSISARGDPYSIAVDVNGAVLYIITSEMLYSCRISLRDGSVDLQQSCHPNFPIKVDIFRGNAITLSNTNPPYLHYITAKDIKIRNASGAWRDAIGRYTYERQFYIASCLRDANNNIHPEECNDYIPEEMIGVSRPVAIIADPHHWSVYLTGGGKAFSCMIEANGTLYDCKKAYNTKEGWNSMAIAPYGEHIYMSSSDRRELDFCTINYHNRTFDKCTVYHDLPISAASLAYR